MIVDVDLSLMSEPSLRLRVELERWLDGQGCPTAPSNKPSNLRAAFVASDPGNYLSKKQVWEHAIGLTVELYTPGSPSHVKLYELDGQLPVLAGNDLDEWLREAGFERKHPAKGSAEGDGTWEFPGWQRRGSREEAPAILDSPTNMRLALQGIGRTDCWRYDEWFRRTEWLEDGVWRELTDFDVLRFREEVGEEYGASPLNFIHKESLVRETILSLARDNSFNPQTEAFRAKEWDGYDRYRQFALMLGQHEELAVEYCKLLVRGVVVRAHHPGAVFPYIVNIYSAAQGVGKGDCLKAISNDAHSILEEHMFIGYDVEKKFARRAERSPS